MPLDLPPMNREREPLSESFIVEADRNDRLQVLIRIYGWTGVTVAVTGALYLIISNLDLNLDFDQLVAVFGIGVGIALSIVAFVMRRARAFAHGRAKHRTLYEIRRAQFLANWTAFEDTANSALAGVWYPQKTFSTRSLLAELGKREFVSSDEIPNLMAALEVRNRIAHTDQFIPSELLDELSAIVKAVTSKLAARVN